MRRDIRLMDGTITEQDIPKGTLVIPMYPSWWGKTMAILVASLLIVNLLLAVFVLPKYSTKVSTSDDVLQNRRTYCTQELVNQRVLGPECKKLLGLGG